MLLFILAVAVVCRLRPDWAPAAPRLPWRDRFRSLSGVSWILLLFALVMGGMFAGWFTPTEAAAVGAAGSVLLAVAARRFTFSMLAAALMETLRTSCMVMVIVAGASVFGHFLQITNLPTDAARLLASLPLPPLAIMVVILLFYLVGGAFLDALALVLLTIPIFYPVVRALGFDPIWFGVIIVLVTQMGVITPPVGVNVYVVSGIEREVPMQQIFKRALPFAGIIVLGVILLMLFPDIALALPRVLYK